MITTRTVLRKYFYKATNREDMRNMKIVKKILNLIVILDSFMINTSPIL